MEQPSTVETKNVISRHEFDSHNFNVIFSEGSLDGEILVIASGQTSENANQEEYIRLLLTRNNHFPGFNGGNISLHKAGENEVIVLEGWNRIKGEREQVIIAKRDRYQTGRANWESVLSQTLLAAETLGIDVRDERIASSSQLSRVTPEEPKKAVPSSKSLFKETPKAGKPLDIYGLTSVFYSIKEDNQGLTISNWLTGERESLYPEELAKIKWTPGVVKTGGGRTWAALLPGRRYTILGPRAAKAVNDYLLAKNLPPLSGFTPKERANPQKRPQPTIRPAEKIIPKEVRPKEREHFWAATDKGKVRENNEDCFGYVSNPEQARGGSLFLVADGVGGEARGEEASKLAVQVVKDKYYRFLLDHPQSTEEQALRFAIKQANTEVFNNGSCTTLVAAIKRGNEMLIANVGDSRAYLISPQEHSIKQITVDHSAVYDMVRMGLLAPEKARHHPLNNVINRSLGNKPTVDIDTFSVRLGEGQRILLCTDGLTNMLTDSEILAVFRNNGNNKSTCEELIRFANAKGGHDNITVLSC